MTIGKVNAGAQQVADEDVSRFAATGVAGSGSALPQLDTVQRSFGRHDVSGVQAHVGGAAGEASRAIGAEAYATGDQVAFASQPDLFLIAHEAAHVVQQQGGVHMSGGVGQAGDPYERHADAVAEAVVAGRSAEPLLDQVAGGGGRRPLIQRTEAAAPAYGDPRAYGIDASKPLIPGVAAATAFGAPASDNALVQDWLTTHKNAVGISAMPDIIRRVRVELGSKSKTLATASPDQILEWLHAGATTTGVQLPTDALPSGFSADEVKVAAASGFSLAASITANLDKGKFNVVAFGKTPEVAKGGVQVAVDPGGVALNSESQGSKVSVQATSDMGVKFSTTIGPLAFTAGIDQNQWQIGLSFGPEVTQLSSLAGIMSNVQSAVAVAAKNLAAGTVAKPEALYESIKPHLPGIKDALSAAQGIAAVKPGQVSVGVKATGPGYKPFVAEGAVQGITVMATMSFTF